MSWKGPGGHGERREFLPMGCFLVQQPVLGVWGQQRPPGGPVSRLPARSGRPLRPPQMACPCAAAPSSTSRLPRPSRQKLPSGTSISLEPSLNPCR